MNLLRRLNQKSSLRLRELEPLEKKGIGLSELKMLHNLVNEFAEQRGLQTENNAVVKIFFDEISTIILMII